MISIIAKLRNQELSNKDLIIDTLLALCIVNTIFTAVTLVAVYGLNFGLCISRYDTLFWNMGKIFG